MACIAFILHDAAVKKYIALSCFFHYYWSNSLNTVCLAAGSVGYLTQIRLCCRGRHKLTQGQLNQWSKSYPALQISLLLNRWVPFTFEKKYFLYGFSFCMHSLRHERACLWFEVTYGWTFPLSWWSVRWQRTRCYESGHQYDDIYRKHRRDSTVIFHAQACQTWMDSISKKQTGHYG